MTPFDLKNPRHRFWASPRTMMALLALSVLCIGVMHRFSVRGGPELDLAVFMTRAQFLAKTAAWKASGLLNTTVFYLLDGVWSALWNSFFFALFHVAAKFRPCLLSWRSRVSSLLIAVWILDLLENAGIVTWVMRYPTISSPHYGVIRGLTALKWAGIAGFGLLVVFGAFGRETRRVEDD